MPTPDRIQVAIFTGGRGTASIVEALSQHPQIAMTLLVNTYDDGLSTGRLRRYVPGMLGPSDIRKNLMRLMTGAERSERAKRQLLEYRFGDHADPHAVRETLRGMAGMASRRIEFGLGPIFGDLALRDAECVASFCHRFVAYLDHHPGFDFRDCALGNIWFAGAFLGAERDFNRAVAAFHELCRGPHRALNVTDGQALVLVGLKTDGTLLASEAEIVSEQSQTSIADIYLLPDYPGEDDRAAWEAMTPKQRRNFLRDRSVSPSINPEAATALSEADLIVYGPGTQHSSLFPSYLTEGVAERIASNTDAEKVFVANILKDREIQSETANSLTEKLLYYLNGKGRTQYTPERMVTRFFFHAPRRKQPGNGPYLGFEESAFSHPMDRVLLLDWETNEPGAHLGGRVADELIRLVNRRARTKLRAPRYMVSIIVPALNEASTVTRVLNDLARLDFQGLGLGKEVLLVDGGSTDNTVERAREVPDVTVLTLNRPCGRGEAIRHGIERAAGDVIVVFPSDAEYDPKDVAPMVMAVVRNEFPVVFGSRNIKLMNLSQRIREMYHDDRRGYMISKYGGLLMGMLSLALYHRHVSDVFCTVKAFDARLLRSLDLKSKGVDLEAEIVAKLWRRGAFISEVPVSFRPRPDARAKKTTVGDGLRALGALVRCRFSRHENALDHHPGV